MAQEATQKTEKKVATGQPVASFSKQMFNFGSLVDGEKVVHDFVIKNTGKAVLEIQKVKTAWGCTAVSYPRQLPPGGEGKISIKVDTKNNGGKRITKVITVTTNDPNNKVTDLLISGNVEKVLTITPREVKLTGEAGKPITSEIIIKPEKKFPFKITGIKAKRGENFSFSYKKKKLKEGGEGFVLTITNKKKDKGRFTDSLTIETDSKYRPSLHLHVVGNLT